MSLQDVNTSVICLERVLRSQAFAQADRLRDFLRFIAAETLAGRADDLKETVIGVTVYGRPAGYDPKLDNIVRTSARRVRMKLEEYYASEGAGDPVRVELPKGSYALYFRTGPIEPPATTNAAPMPTAPIPAPAASKRTRRYWYWVLGLAATVLGAVCGVVLSRMGRQDGPLWHSVPFTSATGYQGFPAFSPDGKRIAFSWEGVNKGPRQIYLQTLGSQTASRFTSEKEEALRPAWSPDGQELAFVERAGPGRTDIFSVSFFSKRRKIGFLNTQDPWLCNEPRLSWSPDGTQLASTEAAERNSGCGIVIVAVDSGKKKPLTHPPRNVVADLEPAFSPDGKHVAFLRQLTTSIGDIYLVPTAGGQPRRITFDDREIRGFTWSADGKSFIVASRRGGIFLSLWKIPLDGKGAVTLAEGPSSLGFPSSSGAGDRVAYVNYLDDYNIWRFNDGSNQAFIESRATDWSPQYSPDGRKVAFVSDRSGTANIWLANAGGGSQVRLTDFATSPAGSPAWSPDGRRMAFDVRTDGQSDIWLIDPQPGRKPLRLTSWSSNEAVPAWSNDGRSVYFASTRSGEWNVYKVSAAGGEPVQITHGGGFRALESGDGRFVYFTKSQSEGLWRVALDGDRHEDLVRAQFASRWSDWAFGPRGLFYLARDSGAERGSPASINFLPDGQSMPRQLGRTQKGSVGFSVSPDGSSFLYAQLDQSGSAILLLEH